ncbi:MULTISPECIES: putative photosynthetic complex assembly protein PuhE [Hyphomicrobiales]|uniref:Photosynthetic complex assembly protein PuhE n=1 Tax=Bosea massiliensis TaxID=151419 RepID=A0ABW0P1R4_9HYPH|nr:MULTISPECIES: putative photosynthetic complex assembly protein PuhE [Hyphomicrobiales]
MVTYGLPIVATLIAWWFSTGAILYLDGLPKATFRWSLAGATLALLAAFWGLAATAGDTSVAGAYLAVFSALVVWGWNELAFLLGYVAGPNRAPCDPALRGRARFAAATRAILHHELALLASLALVALLTAGGANRFGLATFALLFAMRLSTKLNIFLGVPNTTVEFLPDHLAYLKSHFRQRAMNLLFPLSVTAATLLSAWLVHSVVRANDPFLVTGFVLLATFAVLGVIEHWFLVLPLPVADLWAWGLRSRETAGAEHPAAGARPVLPPATGLATPRAVPPPTLVA